MGELFEVDSRSHGPRNLRGIRISEAAHGRPAEAIHHQIMVKTETARDVSIKTGLRG